MKLFTGTKFHLPSMFQTFKYEKICVALTVMQILKPNYTFLPLHVMLHRFWWLNMSSLAYFHIFGFVKTTDG